MLIFPYKTDYFQYFQNHLHFHFQILENHSLTLNFLQKVKAGEHLRFFQSIPFSAPAVSIFSCFQSIFPLEDQPILLLQYHRTCLPRLLQYFVKILLFPAFHPLLSDNLQCVQIYFLNQ